MKLKHAVLACVCAGLPPPGLAAPGVLAPWDDSVAPYFLDDRPVLVDRDTRVDGAIVLLDTAALDVQAGRTLTLAGDVHGAEYADPSAFGGDTRWLFKLGDGHLQLAGGGDRRGATFVLRGNLGLSSSSALGHDGNTLTLLPGTRLELAAGLTVGGQSLLVAPTDPVHLMPGHWAVAPAASGSPAMLHVAQGEAAWTGNVILQAAAAKDGAGTLALSGLVDNQSGQPFIVRQGGLRMDGGWLISGGPAHEGLLQTQPGTALSGTGYVHAARVAGDLHPGGPAATGTLSFGEHLQLAPTARTHIRIDADGAVDAVSGWGSARLGGDLVVHPVPGAWSPQTRWTIVQADDGLEFGPSSDPGAVPGDGRFTRVASTLRYLDPVLTYAPTRVTLGLRYNRMGLNTADGAWRSALLDDSRFLRDAALAHTLDDTAWAQAWGANTTRAGQGGWPGDDRDTGGLQVGFSRTASAWRLAAFAGVQTTDLTAVGDDHGDFADSDPAAADRARDTAYHVGLGASRALGPIRLTMGAAHAWHSARLQRRPDPGELPLRVRARAGLTQLWLEAKPDAPLPVGPVTFTPYAQLAWLRLHRPSLQENGSLAAAHLAARTDTRWVSLLGVRLQERWATAQGDAVLTVDAGLRSLWGPRTLPGSQAYRADPGVVFDVRSPLMPRHALQLALGVDAPVARGTRLAFAYTGQHGGGSRQHGAWLGVTRQF